MKPSQKMHAGPSADSVLTGMKRRMLFDAEKHEFTLNAEVSNNFLESNQPSLKAIGGQNRRSIETALARHMRACRCFACRTYSHTESQSTNNKTAHKSGEGGRKLKIKDLISKEFTSHTRDVLGNNNELLTFYMHNQFGSQTFEDGTTGAALAYQQSQMDFTQKVFAKLDPLIDLDFKEKNNFNGSDIDIYSLYGYSEWDIDTVGEANKHGKGSNAYWDIYWRHGGVNNKTDIVNNTIVHEIGHVLGLSHPKERPYSKRWNDRDTVMSYNKSGFKWNSWFTNLDIKTLQKIWGRENDHKDQLHEGKINIANKLFGENGNDRLYGGKKSDTLKGGKGSDRLRGGAGNDTLKGGKGSDRLRGGAGNDTINGGAGRDTAVFSARENQINLKRNKFQNSGDGHDLLISIENINAGGGNDVVTGNRSANTLKGQNGNDSLNGAPGHDYLIGGRGHDNLKGGSGNDKLIGGQGHDKLFGGSGRDTFVLTEGSGHDHILDFHNGQDRIGLMAGVTNLVVRNSGLNANIYKGNDLLAVVQGGANQLLQKGEFLV